MKITNICLAQDPPCYFWQYSLLLANHAKTVYERNYFCFCFVFLTGPMIILCTSFVLKGFQRLMSNLSPKAAKLFYFCLVVWTVRVSQQTLMFQIGWESSLKKLSWFKLFQCFLCGCLLELNIFVCQWKTKHTACDWLNAPSGQDGKHFFFSFFF